MKQDFLDFLQQLVESSQIVIDRLKGTSHQRYPDSTYPVDYGYLAGTSAMDAGGVDIWVGSLKQKQVVGVLGTVDLLKKDTELKILWDCTDDEIKSIMEFVNVDKMRAMYIRKDS